MNRPGEVYVELVHKLGEVRDADGAIVVGGPTARHWVSEDAVEIP